MPDEPLENPTDRPTGDPAQAINGAAVDGEEKEPEGLDPDSGSWGDYPIDDILIRNENRTIHDVIRRIDKKAYVMDPDF